MVLIFNNILFDFLFNNILKNIFHPKYFLSKLTLLCGEMVLPIGWTELQLKVAPMVGRYVDLRGMFEVSDVIWFLKWVLHCMFTIQHIRTMLFRKYKLTSLVKVKQLSMSTNIINNFMTITMIGRDFDQKKKGKHYSVYFTHSSK